MEGPVNVRTEVQLPYSAARLFALLGIMANSTDAVACDIDYSFHYETCGGQCIPTEVLQSECPNILPVVTLQASPSKNVDFGANPELSENDSTMAAEGLQREGDRLSTMHDPKNEVATDSLSPAAATEGTTLSGGDPNRHVEKDQLLSPACAQLHPVLQPLFQGNAALTTERVIPLGSESVVILSAVWSSTDRTTFFENPSTDLIDDQQALGSLMETFITRCFGVPKGQIHALAVAEDSTRVFNNRSALNKIEFVVTPGSWPVNRIIEVLSASLAGETSDII